MNPRLEEINNLLISYSLGDFDRKIEPSQNQDEIDAFIININMLGEELKASTISKNYFNNIFHSVSDKLFVIDNSGEITDVNNTVCVKLGYRRDKLIGTPIDSLSGEKKQILGFIKKGLDSASSILHWESTLFKFNGEAIPVYCSCSYLHNQNKERIGYLLSARDISEIKKYEKSLVDSEKKYRNIFEKSSDCLFVIDNTGKFLDLNMAGFELFKLSGEDSAYANFYELLVEGNEKDFFKKDLAKDGSVIDFKIKIRDIKGDLTDCLISANSIYNEQGKTLGYQGIIKDVSKQKNLENLVIKTIVDTQEQERKRIARDLHDSLGQQLSAIKFYLGSLKSMQENSKSLKYEEILSKSNNAVSDVLKELSSISFNLMPGTLQNFGVAHAIKELCHKTELSDLLKFNLNIAEEFIIKDQTIEITLFRITQEFINNTIKHSNASKICMDMSIDAKTGNIKVNLRDNGKGFVLKEMLECNRMGLKNMRSRVESHNGILKIKTAPNKGTSYEIVIPYKHIRNEEIKNTYSR